MLLLQAFSGLAQLFFPVAILAVFYFFLIRPEQNKKKKQSNFINIPMLNQGIKQLHAWGVNNIQEYCKNITKEGLKTIDKNKIWYEEDDYRAWHLFGLFPKKNLKKILKKIREKNIHISLRGETIRVSPNVYNNKRELDKFFNTISKT